MLEEAESETEEDEVVEDESETLAGAPELAGPTRLIGIDED